MRNKHPKGWMDTPHHIEFLKKDEDDERRDKRRCLFFTQNKCSYSSYTWGTSLEGGDLCRPDFTRKVTVSKHVIRSAKKNVQAMYNVAQLFIGAVEQKNKNVISLQILVSQLPQVKDK